MLRRIKLMAFVIAFSLLVVPAAFAAQPDNVGGGLGNKAPNFSAGVFADGQTFGTKGTTSLPAPTPENFQSYDVLLAFTNGAAGQLPVAEAAPGNPSYNGGRWSAYNATWIGELANNPPLVTSYAEALAHVAMGNLVLEEAHNYFQCPLLPVK